MTAMDLAPRDGLQARRRGILTGRRCWTRQTGLRERRAIGKRRAQVALASRPEFGRPPGPNELWVEGRDRTTESATKRRRSLGISDLAPHPLHLPRPVDAPVPGFPRLTRHHQPVTPAQLADRLPNLDVAGLDSVDSRGTRSDNRRSAHPARPRARAIPIVGLRT